ncbi:Protein SIA1 [Spathaspora sp. JA1]|nr:Protein SIA1 [Spathaspora sp. JA1]
MYMNRHYKKLILSTLLLLGLLSSVFYILQPKPFSPPDIEILDLASNEEQRTNQQLTNIITDVSIIKCNKYSCKIPPGYHQIFPQLNYYDQKLKRTSIYSYYVAVKEESVESATRAIIDLSLTPQDEDYEEVVGGNTDFKLYQKSIIINMSNQLPKDMPLIRSIEVLFGTNDLLDSRDYHTSLHLSNDESIHPILSIFKLSMEEQHDFIENKKLINIIKQKEIINIGSQEKYKIMQLSDLHFGQDLGRCDSSGGACTSDSRSSDLRTLKFIDESLIQENPDLIVITGDLFDISRSIDYKSVILKSLQPILSHGVKFLFTFGDDITSDHYQNFKDIKASIIRFISSLPNCLNSYENKGNRLHGVTNQNLKVNYEPQQQQKRQILISILDTENQNIDDSQINSLYRINNDRKTDDTPTYKLLFFHYPIPQHRPKGKFKLVGAYNEKHPLKDNNSKFIDDAITCGYSVISVGHEHENDACILGQRKDIGDIWLCYNGVTGDSGITRIDSSYQRKMRLFEVDFVKARIISWKRGETDKKPYDHQLIFDNNKVAG